MNYRVILCDPPWSYQNPDGCRGVCPYKSISTVSLCGEYWRGHVAQLKHPEQCTLILWATWPKLPDALAVMAAWGFQYISGFPWVKVTSVSDRFGRVAWKPGYGVGWWTRGISELVLIGVSGKQYPSPRPKQSYIGLLSPNYAHSRKPDSIYQYCESMKGPYCEMFARRRRVGWYQEGDQLQ